MMPQPGYVNMTVSIPTDQRKLLKKHLAHGQFSKLTQMFFDRICDAIEKDEKDLYLNWLYNDQEFILKP